MALIGLMAPITLDAWVTATILVRGPITVGGSGFDIGSLLYAVALTVVGYQAVLFAILSRVYAQAEGFLPTNPRFDAFQRRLSMEKGVTIGLAVFVFGLMLGSQTILSGLFLSLLRIRIVRPDPIAVAEIAPQDSSFLLGSAESPAEKIEADS